MSPTAAESVVDVLARAGVRRFYTVPGESFLEIIDAVAQHPDLALISTRHESGAAFMAEAEGKLTGVPAAAMATRAVGAANLAIGVHTAHQDRTPLLALLGQVETEHLGKEAFQEVDLPAFYAQITTWGATVHRADRAGELTAEAFRRATSTRPGPAVLAFPADVLGQPGRPVDPPVARLALPAATPQDCAEVSDLLEAARAPVAVAGAGAYPATAALVMLAERHGVGVYSAFRRQDVFPNEHPNYLGHLTLGAPAPTLDALRNADLVLVLGARLDEVTTQGFTLPGPQQRVLHVDADAAVLGDHRRVDLAIVSSVDHFLAGLLGQGGGQGRDWSSDHQAFLRASDPGTAAGGEHVHPAQVMAALRRHVAPDTILVNDAGNFSAFAHRYWRFSTPRTQLGPVSGAMGYAVPGAVGAQLAAPQRRVVALAGDGGFLMTGVELETAVRTGAPVTVVVFQNGLYGTIAMHQARASGRTAGVGISPVDIVAFSRSLGAYAVAVDRPDDLDDALHALPADSPAVLAVRTDPDVISPGATLSGLVSEARS
jgi:acetolactate synthase-1/2/3 large subunit